MTPRDRLLKQFRDLVGVRLERINRAIVELESGGNVETGRKALRELHGLKGEARMMGFDSINVLVHEMEELVRSIEIAQYAPVRTSSADALLKSADAVTVLSGLVASDDAPEVEKLVAWLRERTRVEQAQLGGAVPEPVVLPAVPKTAVLPGQPACPSAPAPRWRRGPRPTSSPGSPTPRPSTRPAHLSDVRDAPAGGAGPDASPANTARPPAPSPSAQPLWPPWRLRRSRCWLGSTPGGPDGDASRQLGAHRGGQPGPAHQRRDQPLAGGAAAGAGQRPPAGAGPGAGAAGARSRGPGARGLGARGAS